MENTVLKYSRLVKHLHRKTWVSPVDYYVLKKRWAWLLLNICVECFAVRPSCMLSAAGCSYPECIYRTCHILWKAQLTAQVCSLPRSLWNRSHPAEKLQTKPS